MRCGELLQNRRRALVAVKRPRQDASLSGRSSRGRAGVLNEIHLLRTLNHECLARLVGYVSVDNPPMAVFELYPEGSLQTALDDGVVSDWAASLPYCSDIAKALVYLHAKGVVHRQVAATNVLLCGRRAVLSNLSRALAPALLPVSPQRQEGGETSRHAVDVRLLPPEALEEDIFAPPADAWALGFLLYTVALKGRSPFAAATNEQARDSIMRGWHPPPASGTPRTVHRLMHDCWHHVPEARPTAVESARRMGAVMSVPELLRDCYE